MCVTAAIGQQARGVCREKAGVSPLPRSGNAKPITAWDNTCIVEDPGRPLLMRVKTIYERPRLNRLLNQVTSHPLALIIAGAGFGKTTAVREWLKKTAQPRAWMSLTDGDLSVFWDKLCDAVGVLDIDMSDELRISGVPNNPWEVSRVVSALRLHCTEPFLLCIDDFHHIPDDSPVVNLLNTLVLELIDNLHILILSRREPAIPIGTLASKGLCAVIGEESLRFDESETAGYLSMRGLRLTKSAVNQIRLMSEGWISAIFLLSEGVRAGNSIAERKNIDRLFAENLMTSLPAQKREMLCRLAPFESMSAECAVEAMGNDGAELLLDDLVRENAFVTLDDQGFYHFHPLLREYLVRRCPNDEAQRNAYRRAGLWCLNQTEPPSNLLVEYFEKADCVEELLELLNHPGLRRLSSLGMQSIYSMVEHLPDDECTKYPFPFLQIIFFLMLSGDPHKVRIASAMHTTMKDYFSTHEHPHKNRILGELLVISRVTSFGAVPEGAEPLEEASLLLGGRYSDTLRPSDPFTFGLPMLSESEWMGSGELDAAVERCQYNPYELVADGFGRGSEHLIRAEAALLRCRTDEARLWAMQADEEAKRCDQWFVMASARFVLMRGALYLSDDEEAVAQMSSLRSLVLEADRAPGLSRVTIPALRGAIALCECFLNTTLRRGNDIPVDFRNGTYDAVMVGLGIPEVFSAQAMLSIGNASGAERICYRIDRLPTVCQEARITRSIVEALVRERLYGKGAGNSPMIKALEMAQADGVLLPFAENPEVRSLLSSEGLGNRVQRSFLARIRAVCDTGARSSRMQSPIAAIELTERELEILRLAARGMTRAEIAEEAHIKDDTVKKHLSAAYRKLGASNRTEALRNARIEGLL